MIKNLKALFFGLFVALLLCEIILRIYNPFTNFTKQGKLILPANQKTVFNNKWIKQLDQQIHYSRNTLGFRGPEPADSIHKLNSIICIGGSTTECRFLSDHQTWSYLLGEYLKDSIPNLWVNNAGIDGHSTFGHLLLLKEYVLQLKPKYVLLLTGVNDVETAKPEIYDLMNENKLQFSSLKAFLKSVLNKTEIGATAFQLYAVKKAYKKGLIHKEVDFSHLPDTSFTQQTMDTEINNQQNFTTGYKQRLNEIVSLCKLNGITPLLLTQPSMYGSFTDSSTMVQMGLKYLPSSSDKRNNFLQGAILERYNDVTRSFSTTIPVIDLDSLMPKKSIYYYDFIHFNKKGAAKVAELLANELMRHVRNQY